MALFITLYQVVLTFESVDEILKCDQSQMNAIEQCFSVVLFIMLSKVILTFEFVGEILNCYHSNESSSAVRYCGVLCFTHPSKITVNLFTCTSYISHVPFSAAAFCFIRIRLSSEVASSFGLSSSISPAE